LVFEDNAYWLAGISTFLEGYGGRFGDVGGGIVLDPYYGWIFATIPEPRSPTLFAIVCVLVFLLSKDGGHAVFPRASPTAVALTRCGAPGKQCRGG
jgi:hypothetical protein